MRILLTGVAGFIGSHTARALLARGDVLYGVDDFNDFYDSKQKEKNVADFIDHERFQLATADIRDEKTMRELFDEVRPDLLLHLAARAGVRPSIQNPELYYDVNLRGTLNLLEAARAVGTNRVVFASSSSVYGSQEKIPFSESDFTENPISPYAATKRAGENMLYAYSQTHGFKVTCLRFFTVYGPSGRPDMAPYFFTRQISEGNTVPRFGDGSTRRDYTYIDDIVSGIVAACDNPFDYEIFNLGNHHPEELRTLIGIIEELLGKKAVMEELPEQAGDVPVTYADISKAKSLLGYEPKTSLREGMEKFVYWFNHHR